MVRKLFKKFWNPKSEEDRMVRFLSQAYDQAHLEYLMQRWDEKQRQERCDARRHF
jgi:hypothetical protein